MRTEHIVRLARWLSPVLLLGLSACSLLTPNVDSATRDAIATNARPGMTMATARANLESSGFRCTTRSGSYFDENGEEHAVDGTFASCMKPAGGLFNFACAQRPHVVVVPDGDRVAQVIVDTAPACTETRPTAGQTPRAY